jgi:hypothetical protein
VREVVVRTVTSVATGPPNSTVAPVLNPVPVTVILVPPLAGPDVGETEVTVGGTYVGVDGDVGEV